MVLDRQVGQHKLHDKVFIIACGNLETDNAIVHTMSSALISRFAHFTIEINDKEWKEWAYTNNIDKRITSYLGFKPKHLYTFNPDTTEPYASPRTWEMLSKVIINKPVNNQLLPLLASLIGEGVSREFLAYINLYSDLPTYMEVIAKPEEIELSTNLGVQWAMLSLVTHSIDEDTANKAGIFLQRLPMELQVCALREIKLTKPTLIKSHLTSWFNKLASEIF